MKKQWLWTPPLPSHHLKLVRCPPEHDAIHPDGSLPILQGRFPCQVHKLLWADHMFIVLERSTEVQDLLRLTQAWWNCSTTHSPFQLQPAPGVHRKEWHGSTSHRPQYRTLWYSPSLEYAPVARGQGKGQLFTWYLACCSPKKVYYVPDEGADHSRESFWCTLPPERHSKSLIDYSLSDMHSLSHQKNVVLIKT